MKILCVGFCCDKIINFLLQNLFPNFVVLFNFECDLYDVKGFELFVPLKVFDLFTTVFIILRRKRNQLSMIHIYHQISNLLIIYAYQLSNNLKLICGFMTLSILSSAFKFLFYFLNAFTHVSALYRFLGRFKAMLNYAHNLMLSWALIHSIKLLLCHDAILIFIIHVLDAVNNLILKKFSFN